LFKNYRLHPRHGRRSDDDNADADASVGAGAGANNDALRRASYARVHGAAAAAAVAGTTPGRASTRRALATDGTVAGVGAGAAGATARWRWR